MTAEDLIPGQYAIIDSFSDASLGQHLLERGVVPGERLSLERVAPSGDPIAIRVADHVLCLRRREAASIHVQPSEAV
ncbi:MAG: ferrous iron transport protein A [Flavobacteriales bacterium]|nr:ferrous iron transport protein A [Flavobacteriales bacterium]